MIQKMMEHIYERFTEALWQLGYFFGLLGQAFVFLALAITVPLWGLPYRWYYRRRDR